MGRPPIIRAVFDPSELVVVDHGVVRVFRSDGRLG
jgi:hypothetical protein